jgi:Right handed beta helix region/Abnormal spindle-like microcephaly-assoc'd, ASPM-SPD-2-Hydin
MHPLVLRVLLNTRNLAIGFPIAISLLAIPLFGKTINVPLDQPTIQAGINAAINGDIVLVAPGTYHENIDFKGKSITVRSSSGPKVTILDGSQLGTVVTFSSAETLKSVLAGFTVQNGLSPTGGGILINSASPTVRNNVIQGNVANTEGAGIVVESGSPTIAHNIIQNNVSYGAGGGIAVISASPLINLNVIQNNQLSNGNTEVGGVGISVRGPSSAQIIGNLIQKNTWFGGVGGGISLVGAGSSLVENNRITRNYSFQGSGIYIVGESDESIIQNEIDELFGGGPQPVYISVSLSSKGLLFLNNTIIGSNTDVVWAGGFDSNARFLNNIVVGFQPNYPGEVVFHCDTSATSTPPVIKFTDAHPAFAGEGTGFDGSCANAAGTNGNITAEPMFSKTNGLLEGSPAIDTADNSVPDLPTTDLAGNPRIINGKGGPTRIVDMGAYEFAPVDFSPKNWNFGARVVGSSTSKTFKLTNNKNKILNISSFSAPTGYSVSGCGGSVAALTTCVLTVTFQPLTSGTFNGNLVVNDDASSSPQTVALSGRAR